MFAGSRDFVQVVEHFIETIILGILRQHFGVSYDRIHWRAQFVAHVGKEGALRFVRSFRLFARLLGLAFEFEPLGDVFHQADVENFVTHLNLFDLRLQLEHGSVLAHSVDDTTRADNGRRRTVNAPL